MSKTITIALGGDEYSVPRINFGQTEDLADLWGNMDAEGNVLDASGQPLVGKAALSRTRAIAEVVFRRATPPIPDIREIECDVSELTIAMAKVLEFSRLTRSDAAGNVVAGESPAV